MARPIRLTPELLEEVTQSFINCVKKMKISDGELTYKQNLRYAGKDIRAKILFEPKAFAKMTMLLNGFDSEVAWHGTVERAGDEVFVIKDILVYPQEVSGATVNTDQEGYTKWLIDLEDDVANSLFMQGHSHVNMATSPSSVDLEHQEKILKQITDDGFYIFMIYNKRMEHTIRIYDFKTNTMYEDADIEVSVSDDGDDLDAFMEDAKQQVVSKVVKAYPAGYTAWPNTAYRKPFTSTRPVTQQEIDYDELIYGGHELYE